MTKTNMNKGKSLLTIIIAIGLICSLMVGTVSTAGAASKRSSSAQPKKITVSSKSVTMNVGAAKKLKVSYKPKKTATKKYVKKHAKWKSSNKSVATVKGGKIKAVRPGRAVVSVKVGKRSAKCTVTVKSPLKSIRLSRSSAELQPGESTKLNVIYVPSNTTDSKSVSWASSDPSVAEVSNGTVTAKNIGKTTITARSGRHTASCVVEVRIPLRSISLNKTEATIIEGSSMRLYVSYDPSDTTDDRTVTWTSNNSNVAAVSDGKVTARSGGIATITARVGNYTASCRVTVRVPLRQIVLNRTYMTINAGDSQTLAVSYIPSNTTDDRSVTWTSSNTGVATVSNGRVTAKNGGTATITARVGNCTAKCTVTVKVPLKKITLSNSAITVQKNCSSTLKVYYYPSNTTDNRAVTWTSSNTGVATVSGGKVYAKKNGTAVITAKVGSCTATCTVTVVTRLQSISLSKTEAGLLKGKTHKLTVSYYPADTTDSRAVTWTSSNTSVATVSGGVITARSGGQTTITAKVGTKTAKCTVFVKNTGVIGTSASVSAQTATVKGTGHAYPSAATYCARLYSDNGCRKQLGCCYSTGNISFNELNVGQAYYIKVTECRKNNTGSWVDMPDSAKLIRVKPTRTAITTYTQKAQVTSRLVSTAKAHTKKVSFYYPAGKKVDYFTKYTGILDDEGVAIFISTSNIDDTPESRNRYNEQIRINGKAYYRYDVELEYRYSKANQAKYLKAVNKIKAKLHGSDKNKVKQYDSYLIKNTKYDYARSSGCYDSYNLFIKKKAVCNGYARGACVVLNLAGVKCEYVSGKAYTKVNGKKGWYGHAWNIVKIGNKWYSCDFCWDACVKAHRYLMKGTGNKKFWSEHKLDSTYKTGAWKKAHPMAKGDK